MKRWVFTLVFFIGWVNIGFADTLSAQARVAFYSPATEAKQSLVLRSADIEDGREIPKRNSSYGQSISPQLSWTPGPPGTVSYALLLEDADGVKDGKTIVHWVVYNIPADTTGLPPELSKASRLSNPDGLLQGVTISGATGYLGPRPRAGDGPHHYHFQLFALDKLLNIEGGATREDLLAAITGHILAKGQLIGIYIPPSP